MRSSGKNIREMVGTCVAVFKRQSEPWHNYVTADDVQTARDSSMAEHALVSVRPARNLSTADAAFTKTDLSQCSAVPCSPEDGGSARTGQGDVKTSVDRGRSAHAK